MTDLTPDGTTPIRAHRAWYLTRGRLASTYHLHPWSVDMQAMCVGPRPFPTHDAPAVDCRCGLYGCTDLLAPLANAGVDGHRAVVFGAVDLWGTIQESRSRLYFYGLDFDYTVYRAQYARIVGLYPLTPDDILAGAELTNYRRPGAPRVWVGAARDYDVPVLDVPPLNLQVSVREERLLRRHP